MIENYGESAKKRSLDKIKKKLRKDDELRKAVLNYMDSARRN